MSDLFSHNKKVTPDDEIKIESLDHHGVTTGFVDKLKIVEWIDARLPFSKKHGAIVTHGQRVKAMIINGLGFTQNPIYLSHHFFEGKVLSSLFEKGLRHEHFNDDALDRTLDAIHASDKKAELALRYHQFKTKWRLQC